MPVAELSPSEVLQRWPDRANVVLLDVREPAEVAVAAVAGAVHIPMGEIPARLAELDPERPIVVMCHLGGRSRRVAEFLASRGFREVFNLRGGIDAWSVEVDPDIPRY